MLVVTEFLDLGICSRQTLQYCGNRFSAIKNIYKGIQRSTVGRTVNQIDHLVIPERYAKIVKSARSHRGADHYLVKARMRIEVGKEVLETRKGASNIQSREITGSENRKNIPGES